MNRRRLEHTAREVLPYLHDDEFEMSVWACQTAACAFGSEALSKYGKENGLTVKRTKDPNEFAGFIRYRGKIGCTAAALYYDISGADASWLFAAWSYTAEIVTPVMVAERIESLLACEA